MTLSPEAIRERAYLLWEQEGKPDGKSLEFWFRAKQQLYTELYMRAAWDERPTTCRGCCAAVGQTL